MSSEQSWAYVPKVGDVVTAEFPVKRTRGGRTVMTQRQVFGEVKHVTEKRVMVETLRTSFFGFSRNETWVPRGSVRLESKAAHAKWRKAIGDCNALVGAIREAHVNNCDGGQ